MDYAADYHQNLSPDYNVVISSIIINNLNAKNQ